MPLRSVFSNKPLPVDFGENATIIKRFVAYHNDRTLNSVFNRLARYVKQRPDVTDYGFTMFGIALGDNGTMQKGDHDYCWDRTVECFGDSDEAKRFLGLMLMKAYCADDANWLFIQDSEKHEKMARGEIPTATKYWLDTTGKGYSTNY